MNFFNKLGEALVGGVENVIAFVTSKRVMTLAAMSLLQHHGVITPETATVLGGAGVAGFTITDSMGVGKGSRPNGKPE